jgi:hypothetical protein
MAYIAKVFCTHSSVEQCVGDFSGYFAKWSIEDAPLDVYGQSRNFRAFTSFSTCLAQSYCGAQNLSARGHGCRCLPMAGHFTILIDGFEFEIDQLATRFFTFTDDFSVDR